VSAEGLPSPGDGVVEPIVEAIREKSDLRPVAGIVLGSGLGDAITGAWDRAGSGEPSEIPYGELPGFPPPTVPGHAGKLWLGTIGDRPVAFFQGRIHFYEGHPMPLASLTSRVASGLGASTMVLSAAVGGLDPSIPDGSIVVVRDHINLMGTNPLAGWRYPDGSPAFVDVSAVYDRELADAALRVLRDGGTAAADGVYAAMAGPAYETPAETEMLRRIGATVVGMSTVPEAVAARALGMRVLGLSFVTNAAGGAVSHEEVLLASKTAAEAIGRIVAELVDAF
jgi:purine-nucleoside phosphorylase